MPEATPIDLPPFIAMAAGQGAEARLRLIEHMTHPKTNILLNGHHRSCYTDPNELKGKAPPLT